MSKFTQFFKNLTKNQRIVFIFSFLLIFILIIYFFELQISHTGKIAVTAKFAPYSATIKLNEITIKNNQTIFLLPGSYHLEVSFENFETYYSDLEISSENHYIVGTLVAANSQGAEYAEKHRSEFASAEGLAGQIESQTGAILKQKYPILNYLPINNTLYSISYAYLDSKDSAPIITVKTSPKYLDIAVKKLKLLKNVNLLDYQINFSPENHFVNFNNENPAKDPISSLKNALQNSANFAFSKGQNLPNNYFTTTIYIKDYENDISYAHYRALLKKQKGKWYLVSTPEPLLTKQNTKNIPDDILNAANSLDP